MRLSRTFSAILFGTGVLHPCSAAAQTIPEPTASEVAAVLFFVGDAGNALVNGSPLIHRLRWDVERWSHAASGDSTVAVLFLGDNVYPAGVRDLDDRHFTEDTTRLATQAWTVEGPEARRAGTRGVFLPGNHDWGNLEGDRGVARLRNEARIIDGWAAQGDPVSLLPAAGSPGPAVIEAGPATVVIMDTEWWLQSRDSTVRAAAVDRLEDVLLAAPGRLTIVAGHHPLTSVGPHGSRGILDPAWILNKGGALRQDLGSNAYQSMRADFTRAFAQSDRPLAFVGGHDHSLQVLRTAGPGQPGWTLVSGAGSKVTSVSDRSDVAWAGAQPGYMRLVFLTDGGVDLFVEAAPKDTRECADDAELDACLERGLAAYRTVFSARLR